jgi:hypothetical protein
MSSMAAVYEGSSTDAPSGTSTTAFADEDTLPADDELRDALHTVLGELLAPAHRPRPTAND